MKYRILSLSFMIVFFLTSCGQAGSLAETLTEPSGVSPTLIDTPTALPTSTPDPNHIDPSAILFAQDFEAGNADGIYDFNPNAWSIHTDETGNHIYCNDLSSEELVFHFGAYTWDNYAVEMKVKELEGQAEPMVSIYARFDRYKWLMYYGTLNFKTGSVGLAYYKPSILFSSTNIVIKQDKWFTLRLEVAGDRIQYFIDDQLIGSGIDSNRTEGKAGLDVLPNTKVCIDDIRVWQLTKDGQITQLPPRTINTSLSIADRLATHKFPKLFYQNQDSDPKEAALSPAYLFDLLTLDAEAEKSEWSYLGPSGIIRSQNPNTVVLAMTSVQEYFPQNTNSKIGRAFIAGIKPEWVMMDTYGNPFPAFNYGNGEWSTMLNLSTDLNKFIPEFLNKKVMSTGLFDGIYYDGIAENWGQAQPSANRPSGPLDMNRDGRADSTADLNSGMDQGLKKLLKETRSIFPTGSIITGNTGWDGALLLEKDSKSDTVLANMLNGRMIEGFLNWGNHGVDWLKSMRAYFLMQQVSTEPKTPLIMAYCTGTDYDHLRYVLASSLMYDAYFTCTNSQETGEPYTANWWYDEYSVDLKTGKAIQSLAAKGYLGMPLGESYSVKDKNILLSDMLINNDWQAKKQVWRRDFENGIVLVNPSSNTATIDLGGNFRKIFGEHDPKFNDGSLVTNISLPAQSGIILLNLP